MRAFACATAFLSLGACVGDFRAADTGHLDVRAAIADGQMRSPREAGVAIYSLEGAPAPVESRFRQAMAAEASGRQITIAEPALARYLARGYLNAYATETGTAVTYVWDVFDADKKRQQRLSDTIMLPDSAADSWSLVDDRALQKVAARSADDLALYLAATPEAVGTASPDSTTRAAVADAVEVTPPLGPRHLPVN
jgi:hypothetical protein